MLPPGETFPTVSASFGAFSLPNVLCYNKATPDMSLENTEEEQTSTKLSYFMTHWRNFRKTIKLLQNGYNIFIANKWKSIWKVDAVWSVVEVLIKVASYADDTLLFLTCFEKVFETFLNARKNTLLLRNSMLLFHFSDKINKINKVQLPLKSNHANCAATRKCNQGLRINGVQGVVKAITANSS